VAADWLTEFLEREQLPSSYALTVERLCRPLADRCAGLRTAAGRTVRVGLCGLQGSGKSTAAAATAALLQARGLRAVAISIDDFYLGRQAREWLAARVHPLLVTRGPPGTHDVALACGVLDGLGLEGAVPLPAFDKASDERRSKRDWAEIAGPLDVVILEGWCVGAAPQPDIWLKVPVNELEAKEDRDGVWRRFVNQALETSYQALFGRLDYLVFLQAPSFEVVAGWRGEQERKLRARTGLGMDEPQLARFIAHYERLSRWILEDLPGRADWVVRLDAERRPAS
jgi:D-glycerate 3-kinase